MHNVNKEELRLAEHIAIGCACGATVVVVALFLVPKTPGVVVFSMVLIFVLMCHPVLVLLPKLTKRIWPTVMGMMALVIASLVLAAYAWPDTEPVSDLALDEEVIHQPYVIGEAPSVNLQLFNYGPHTINGIQFQGANVKTGEFRTLEDEVNYEESVWAEFVKYVSNSTETITVPYPSRTKTISSIVGSGNHKLTSDQVQDLQAGNNHTYVYFVSAILYKDSSGEHELDYCSFVVDKTMIHNCRHHNGPAEPMVHKGFSFPRRWWIF